MVFFLDLNSGNKVTLCNAREDVFPKYSDCYHVTISFDVNLRTGNERKAREVRDLIDEVFLGDHESVEKKDLDSLKDGEFFYQQKVAEVDTTLTMCVKIEPRPNIEEYAKEVVEDYLKKELSAIPYGVQLVMFVAIGNFGHHVVTIEAK